MYMDTCGICHPLKAEIQKTFIILDRRSGESEEKSYHNEMNVCGLDCYAYVIQSAVERTSGKCSILG